MAAPSGQSSQPRARSSPDPSPLVIKLQIAGAVFVPMAVLGLWLRSQGFFG